MAKKRERQERFVARQWEIFVFDGNREEWFRHFPDCPPGPLTLRRTDMTAEIADDIIRVLQATIEAVKEAKQRGEGKVLPFPSGPEL